MAIPQPIAELRRVTLKRPEIVAHNADAQEQYRFRRVE
jgi:hypothetical protein